MSAITAAIYIITWLLSYFASRKAGLSKTAAALVATGVTGAVHVSGLGDKLSDAISGTTGADKIVSAGEVTVPSVGGSWTDKVTGLLPIIGAGAGVGAGVVTGGLLSKLPSWAWWLAGGTALYVVLK